MKAEKPAVIALAAGVPVALFVLWWVYRKQWGTGSTHTGENRTNTGNKNQVDQIAQSDDKNLSDSVRPDDSAASATDQTRYGACPISEDSSAEDQPNTLSQSEEDVTSDEQTAAVVAEQQTGDEGTYSSVQGNNNNEETTNDDVAMTKIVMVVNKPDDEEDSALTDDTKNLQALKDVDSLYEKTSSEFMDSALPDQTVSSEEATTEAVTPSTINLAGTATNIATETVTSVSAFETKDEFAEQSSVQYSELSHIAQSDYTANDTTNLLDNAIMDSVQFNMSLPGSQSDEETSQSSDDTESARLDHTAAVETPILSEDATTTWVDSTENETSEVDTKPFSTGDSRQGEHLQELDSDSRRSGGSKSSEDESEKGEEGSEDSPEPNTDTPVQSADGGRASLATETKQTDTDREPDENGPNENNNNNSNNDKSCRNAQETTSEPKSTTTAIISSSDTESGETMENGVAEDSGDACKMNGKLDLRPNKNGLVPHTMQNGNMAENVSDETQIYLEFPSDKVGLLIGKSGRNIKNLKQESGAEVIVHTVPFREDIQVLQVVGTPSSVQSAAAKIQKRFKYIALKEFDAASLMGLISPSSVVSSPSVMSPMESPLTPPTFAYPVPDMSQLRLPDGIMVEVVVSSIADCDCVFLQQYTHPTYPALASLEHAMSMCYSQPSTPSLLTPVQVGLVCVAQHGDMWYRAQVIHSSEETNEVTIKLVDYGGYSTVPTTTVKQIRADFITLPFQATECYLDNISPPEDKTAYSIGSTTILQEILKEGEFHARISRYRGDGHPLILLYRRLETKTELVNELLVKEGVAKWFDYGGESLTAAAVSDDHATE